MVSVLSALPDVQHAHLLYFALHVGRVSLSTQQFQAVCVCAQINNTVLLTQQQILSLVQLAIKHIAATVKVHLSFAPHAKQISTCT